MIYNFNSKFIVKLIKILQQENKFAVKLKKMSKLIESFFFKFYVLMQFKTMKHDAIYLNSSIKALCVC